MRLELKNAVKKIGNITYIKPTNLIFESGHFNVLLGATGSGKTSLVRLLAGLDACSEGEILFNDQVVSQLSPQQRNISLVHQFFINYPHMSVYENIASPLKILKLPKSEIEDRVLETAKLLQLDRMLMRYPHELSGGQQQRTALARAIAKESKAIFLDEPLANLDYKLREELREQLPELFKGRGTVVIYATSEPEEALLLGGFSALMEDGCVRQFGKTADIYKNPNTLSSAAIFSNPPINQIEAKKNQNQIELANGVKFKLDTQMKEQPDGNYIMAIRPSHVHPNSTSPNSVEISGTILVTELSGSESSAHFQMGKTNWVSLSHGTHPFQLGETHQFYFEPANCFFFNNNGQRV